jgi:peptide subunit release factor RF-3
VRLPAAVTRWLRRGLGLAASDHALASHSRLLSGLRRDQETAVTVVARLEHAQSEALEVINQLTHQLNLNTKHLAYLDGMLQYLARTSPGIGNAITAYRRHVQAAARKAEADALAAQETAQEAAKTEVPALQAEVIDHAELLPFTLPVDAEVGEG